MDQQKTGKFIKALRGQRKLTQEQLAEILGVSNRSVSRWENGVNMPDLDLLIELSKYFDVEIGEILNGERKCDVMDQKTEDTLRAVADYSSEEQKGWLKRIRAVCLAGILGMGVYMGVDFSGMTGVQPYAAIAEMALGIVLGALLTGLLYSSRHITQIREMKMRLLKRKPS